MQAVQAPDQAQGAVVTSPRRRSPVTTHPRHRNDLTYGDLCRPRVRTMGLGSRQSVSPGCPSGSRSCQGGLHADRTQREVSPGPERGPHPAPCTGHRLGVLLHRLRSEGDVTAPDPTASAGRMQSSAPRVQQARTPVDARTVIEQLVWVLLPALSNAGTRTSGGPGRAIALTGRCPDTFSTWLQLFLLAKFTAGAINPFSGSFLPTAPQIAPAQALFRRIAPQALSHASPTSPELS